MRKLFALLVVVAIFGVIFVVADRLAAGVAQRRIAAQIQKSQKLSAPPAVTIHGFPFLTQVLRGRYTEIDAVMTDPAVSDRVSISALDVTLRGVHLRLADALAGDVSDIPVDSASAVARVSYDELNEAARANLPRQKSTVTFGPGDRHDQVAVSGSYRSSLLSADIDAQAKLVTRRGRLEVEVLPSTLDQVPSVLRPQVGRLLSQAGRLPALPMGFRATGVTTGPDGVTVRAVSRTLQLRG